MTTKCGSKKEHQNNFEFSFKLFKIRRKQKSREKMPLKDLLVVRIIVGVPIKIWTAAGAALLTCIIIYCFVGALIANALISATILCES